MKADAFKVQAAQRGVASLAIALMLVFAILLTLAFTHRSVLFEAKSSANQYLAAQAFEAAEAGLEWTLAQLNSNTPIGDDCLPSGNANALPFRDRTEAALQASCVQAGGASWSCSCPHSGAPQSAMGKLSFNVHLTPSLPAGRWQLSSTGCSTTSAACSATDTHARMQVLLGRLPGLSAVPSAALTVRGSTDFSAANFGIRNTEPATGGITVHSGAAIDATRLQLASAPGAPAAASVIANDTALAQLSAPGLFASLFNMDASAWKGQPAVRELNCESACDAALSAAIGANANTALIWLHGGLRLNTPVVLGTPLRPVLLVADGPVQLQAQAVIHGLVYGTSATWADTAGAEIDGAVVLQGGLQASGNTQIHFDAAALQALHDHTGSYARVAGSWRDF